MKGSEKPDKIIVDYWRLKKSKSIIDDYRHNKKNKTERYKADEIIEFLKNSIDVLLYEGTMYDKE